MYLELLTDATALLRRCASGAEAIEAIANLALPLLGDVCFVDLVEGGRLRRIERAAARPDARERVRALERERPLTATNPVYDVLRSGEPFIAPLVDDEVVRRIAVDDAHFEALRACGLKALLSVPLRDGDHPLGVLTFASQRPRDFDSVDIRFATELASRLGAKLEHLALSQKLADLEALDPKR